MNYKIQPWDHHLKAIKRAETERNVYLGHQMGTGKTATTVNILRHKFQESGRPMRTLILAPKIVLFNWKREFKNHSEVAEDTIAVMEGSTSSKLKCFTGDPDIVITNYESLTNKDFFAAVSKWSPEILVCDECHKCKESSSQRSKRTYQIAKSTAHNILLSGTPIVNSALDIFHQFKILEANILPGVMVFGISKSIFINQWFENKNLYMKNKAGTLFPQWELKPRSIEIFNQLVSRRIDRVMKDECLDLPPLVKERANVELSSEQQRAYKEMKSEFITFIRSQEEAGKTKAVVAQLAITKSIKLQQIVSGFIKAEDGENITFFDNPRFAVLKELLETLTPYSKVIVWANFRENIKRIEVICAELGIKSKTVFGGTNDKQGAIDGFVNDESIRVFIGNQKAAGTGTDGLQLAPYSIYFSRSYSYEDDYQSESRNHRGGSERHERVTRIDIVARGTIDELILGALDKKQKLSDLILDWK